MAGLDAAPELPGCDVVREVSRGGMGVVYEAHQRALNRKVAIKLVLGAARAEAVTLSRFLVESQAAAAVVHPNVVQVHEFGESGGRPYLVMEYCSGGTLADRLSGKRMDPLAAAKLVRKLADGVAAAHSRGIIHRDLKPTNVLFTGSDEPKVTDFGLAKFVGGQNLTQTDAMMGTPAYMAPEQVDTSSGAVQPAADVWALGVILYECLAGARPFAGDTVMKLVAASQKEEPKPLRKLAPGVPADLAFICLKCLRKKASDRYPTAAELATDLDRFIAGLPLASRDRVYRLRRTAGRWWKSVALFAVIGLLVVGALKHRTRDPEAPADPSAALRLAEVMRRVESVVGRRPNLDFAPPHRVTQVDELRPVNAAGFRVISDDRVIDLRGWRKLDPAQPAVVSAVSFQHRRVIAKLAPAEEYRIEYRTTGRDVIPRAWAPSPETAVIQSAARTVRVGQQEMKVRQLGLDTRSIPVGEEFTAQVSATYLDSLQTPDEQWIGVIGFAEALKSSMLLIFPDDKPFADYTLRVAPPGGAAPRRFEGPVISFHGDDRRWLYWEVPRPLEGHVYRVDWTW